MKTLTKTQEVLIDMLTENTGRHMLDSGGAYGRHWEHNQGRDFMSEPATTLSFEYKEIMVSLNVFHWLYERVEYIKGWNVLYQWYLLNIKYHGRSDMRYGDPYLRDMEDFYAWLCDGGLATKGGNMNGTYNTYNGEDMLSQVIQFLYIDDVSWDEETLRKILPGGLAEYLMENVSDNVPIVLLQIHGGCDVRGGYTAPVIFEVRDIDYYLWDNASATIYCPECRANWYTDDSYHWYKDGSSIGKELQECDFLLMEEVLESEDYGDWDASSPKVPERIPDEQVALPTLEGAAKEIKDNIAAKLALGRGLQYLEEAYPRPYVVIDEDGNGLCPVCHKKHLEVWA